MARQELGSLGTAGDVCSAVTTVEFADAHGNAWWCNCCDSGIWAWLPYKQEWPALKLMLQQAQQGILTHPQ